MRNDELQHAFGWTKKNHKYIRKEGDRYIYPEDLQKGGKVGGLFSSKKKKAQAEVNARLDAEQRRLDAVNRMNRREVQRNIPGQALNDANQRQFQTQRRLADKDARMREAARKQAHAQNQDLLMRANSNLARSQRGRTARETLARQGVQRVAYANARRPDGSTATVRRQIDSRGANDRIVSIDQNKSARDVISKRGTRAVRYSGEGENRIRTTVNNDNTRSSQTVDKNAGRVDARSSFKKAMQKAGLFKSKADKAWSKLVKSESKERKTGIKNEQKEAESKLSFKNRMKLKAKRGKKALSNFFNKGKDSSTSTNAQPKPRTEKYIDEQGRTVIPMNESYVYDKRNKRYVRTN